MKKIITSLAALGLFAITAPAFADSPNGPGRTLSAEQSARLAERVSKKLAAVRAKVAALAANGSVRPEVVERHRQYEERASAVSAEIFADGVVTAEERAALRKVTNRGRHLGQIQHPAAAQHGQKVAREQQQAREARQSAREARQQAGEARQQARGAQQQAREARQQARAETREARQATQHQSRGRKPAVTADPQ